MEHLDSTTAQTLDWSMAARLQFVHYPKWVGYPRAQMALEKMEALFAYPDTHRAACLLLVGDTNAGKTALLQQFRMEHADYEREDGLRIYPVLYVQAPTAPDEKAFYTNILEALGAPYPSNEKVITQQWRVLHLLHDVGVRVLIIDEIHNILSGSQQAHRHFLTVLRFLVNEHKVPIVGAGIRTAFNAVQHDEQLANRFETVYLPLWKQEPEFRRVLATFERMLPLRYPSYLTRPDMAQCLLALCEGSLGELATVLRRATAAAIKNGTECITLAGLQGLDYRPKSSRQKLSLH